MSDGRVRDNLVIGGGPAGATAARQLAAAGRDVVLLEKERDAHHKVCGEFLSPEALGYLRQAGVDPARLGAEPIERLRLSAQRSVVETELPFRAMSLSRRVLDTALLDEAGEAGCEVRRGVTVQRLLRVGSTLATEEGREDGAWELGDWVAELSDGSVLRARNVFLATGKHELRGWRRPPGGHADLVGFKLHWRLNATQTEALRGCMDLFVFAAGYGGLSLVEEDVANLCLVVRRTRLRQCGEWRELLQGLCDENSLVSERLAGAEPEWERPLAVSSIPYGYLCDHESGVWPVGDQAAVIPSFTGDGMAIALHSGALAAEMCMAGNSPGEYQQLLRRHLMGSMRVAMMVSRLMVSRAARQLAPAVIPFLAQPIRWIAQSTRISPRALEEHGLNRPEFSLR